MFSVISKLKEKRQVNRFDQLVRPHIKHLYHMAYHLTASEHLAEDLVQDLLTKLYIKTNSLEEIEKLRPWLSTSLTNLFIDSKRQIMRSSITYTDNIQILEETRYDVRQCPDHLLQQEQQVNHVQTAFNQLSDEHRVVLTLHDIEGYSLPELERMLSVSLGTLKSRVFRARNRLQSILENMDDEERFAIENRVNR